MFVTWVLPDSGALCDSFATLHSTGATFPAAWTTYNAGVVGWAGHVYTAKMTGLAPGAKLSYSVTSCGNTTGPFGFVAPQAPSPTAHSLIAVMADMGTVIPLGFATAQQIEKDNAVEPFDLFVLAGDIRCGSPLPAPCLCAPAARCPLPLTPVTLPSPPLSRRAAMPPLTPRMMSWRRFGTLGVAWFLQFFLSHPFNPMWATVRS